MKFSILIGLFFHVLLSHAETPPKKISAREMTIAVNAAILEKTMSTVDMATAATAISSKSTGYELQRELNELKSSFAAEFQPTSSPASYSSSSSGQTINEDGHTILRVGQVASKVAKRTHLGTAIDIMDVGLDVLGMNQRNFDAQSGPSMQAHAQDKVNAWQGFRPRIARELATRGFDDPEFAKVFKAVGLEDTTHVQLQKSGQENLLANVDRFAGANTARINEIITAGYDPKTKSFTLNDETMKRVLKEEIEVVSRTVSKEIESLRQKNEDANAVKQINYQAYQSSITLMSRVIAINDPKAARMLGAAGSAAIQMGVAVGAFKEAIRLKSGAAGALNLAAGIVGIVDGLIGAILGGPDIHKLILDEIRTLRAEIAQLRIEMHERFDQIDKRLDQMMERTELCFARLDKDIGLAREDIESIQTAVGELDKLARDIGINISMSVRDGFFMPVEENIAKCLERPADETNFATYTDCLIDMKTFALRHAANNVSALSRPQAFEGLGSTSELYQAADNNFEASLWKDINMLASFNGQRNDGVPLPQITANPLPNAEDFSRYSRVLVTFLQRFPEFTRHLTNRRSETNPLSVVNDVLEKGDQLKLGIAQFGRSGAIITTLDDYRLLLVALVESIKKEKESFESEIGFTALDAPVNEQPEVSLRPTDKVGEAFQQRNQIGISGEDAWIPFSTFDKLRACPDLKDKGLVDKTKEFREFPIPKNIGVLIPNIYRVAVLQGMGRLLICYHEVDWQYEGKPVQSMTPPAYPIHEDYYARAKFGVSVIFRFGNEDLLVTRKTYVASAEDKTFAKRVTFVTKREAGDPDSGPKFIKGDVHGVAMHNQEGKAVLMPAAENLWNSILKKEDGLLSGTDGVDDIDRRERLDMISREVGLRHERNRATFSQKVATSLSGQEASPVSSLAKALRGATKVLKNSIRLALPKTLYSNDQLYELILSDGERGLLSTTRLTRWFSESKNVFPMTRSEKEIKEKPDRLVPHQELFRQQFGYLDALKEIVLTRRLDGRVVSPGQEPHPALEQSLLSLQLMKEKLELQNASRIDFQSALWNLKHALSHYAGN
jgi:hypothetical protein